ncbi:hypothetical protein [Paenibacillus beijingensis]|uniref:Uncharacterized protein n=1 Tax=Paenibacillus beijingensis TaxID=1126833 RepID=A0A0D5NJP7_9BACL|nr:hypothetical protein [Paenibacillus beijingensis]AJY75207.1 hypothetical protein VN24_12250 [Paenibacillus beijingensis]
MIKKARTKCFGGYMGGGNVGGLSGSNKSNRSDRGRLDPFFGPSLQQRLRGWAIASTLVAVQLEKKKLVGQIISVDGNGFQMTIIDRDRRFDNRTNGNRSNNSHRSRFPEGSIVFVSFKQVNAIAAIH